MPSDMDWRLQGVTCVRPISDSDVVIEDDFSINAMTMTMVDSVRMKDGRLLAFPIPNASALMLNASKLAFAKAQVLLTHEALEYAPHGFVQFSSNADAIDFAEHVMVSVFTAYTALECFANEMIPPWLTYKKEGKKGAEHRVLGKEEIERELALGTKLDVVLPAVFGLQSPKGASLWEDFVTLERVRNRVVHMKYADRRPGAESTDTVWKALVAVPSPYKSAKRLLDYFVGSVPHKAGLEFDNYRPVRPRWHVEISD